MPALSCIKLTAPAQEELRALVEYVIKQGIEQRKFVLPPPPKSNELFEVAASFVTLYSQQQLRGCVGTFSARNPLWSDVCRLSYCSAFEDGRFMPLQQEELADLTFEISILSPLVKIDNDGEGALLTQLVPGVDGLLLQDGNRSALFLPSVWEALKTPEDFVQALKTKGGWPANYWSEDIEVFRFHTTVY